MFTFHPVLNMIYSVYEKLTLSIQVYLTSKTILRYMNGGVGTKCKKFDAGLSFG